MKLAIGLVVKGGKQFIDKWRDCAEKIADVIFVVDNGADNEVKQKLINFPKVKQYLIQKDMGRNQSRDYQKILEMAREEDCDWIWNIDIDELIPNINVHAFLNYLINSRDESVSFPMFEMRGDDAHYVMINEPITNNLKHGRMTHKCFKVLSHLKFNEKDTHGIAIPHNCESGELVPIPIQHFGHYSKKLREEKRKQYDTKSFKDEVEHGATWMEDDDTKVTIKKWRNKEWEAVVKES